MKRLSFFAIAVAFSGLAGAQTYKNPYQYQSPYQSPRAYQPSTPSYGTGSNYSPTYVAPSIRSDGTYVQGHQRSAQNDTKLDNWSTKGNVNPYTGEKGTRNPYKY